MELERLDFYEFYKEEYEKIDRGLGIGAAGIITPKQMINVINIADGNKKELDGWAQGGHQPTYYEILKQIYKLEDDVDCDNVSDLSKASFLENVLSKIIHIHYWNSKFYKLIAIDIPAYINKEQCANLLILNKQIRELSKHYKIRVDVTVHGYVFNPTNKEVLKEKIFDNNSKNNIFEAIKYLIIHNRISDRKSKEVYDDSLLLREQIFAFEEINKKR